MGYRSSLIAGIICAVICAACVGAFLLYVQGQSIAARNEMLAEYGGEQLSVWVATEDIAAGETIERGSVETRTWVSALLPAGAISEGEDVIGKEVGSTILEGEVITTKRLGSSSSSYEIPEGLTAISVPARDVQAVGGALRAGMRTDVYGTGNTSTTLLASQLLVLETSVGEDDIGSGSLSWITLAVPPEQVEEFVVAAQSLDLYFVVGSSGESSVNPEDLSQNTSDEVS